MERIWTSLGTCCTMLTLRLWDPLPFNYYSYIIRFKVSCYLCFDVNIDIDQDWPYQCSILTSLGF